MGKSWENHQENGKIIGKQWENPYENGFYPYVKIAMENGPVEMTWIFPARTW